MIKILIINSTLERSGITNVLYNLCKYLDRNKFEIHILTLSPENSNSRLNDFVDLNVNLHALNLSRMEGVFRLKKRLLKIVTGIDPSVIQTMSYRGSYYAYRFLKNFKRVVTLQGNIYDNYTDEFGKLVGGFIAKNELKAFKNANRRVLCSDSLLHFYDHNKEILVIRNGADPENLYVPNNIEKEKLRLNLNLPSEKNIFISVGSLNQRKDPITIIKAFIESVRADDSLLIVIGDGALMKECRMAAAGLPQILFTGNVINVPDYFKTADAFISSSHSEGLPNTVLEAGLCRLKCILSDIPQHREIFNENSGQAVFFEKGNSNALKKLFNSHQNAYPLTSIKLNARDMAGQYAKLYDELASKK